MKGSKNHLITNYQKFVYSFSLIFRIFINDYTKYSELYEIYVFLTKNFLH